MWAGVWAGGVLETSGSVGPEWQARQPGSSGWGGGQQGMKESIAKAFLSLSPVSSQV